MKFNNVGWIGTGFMGKSMCMHLLNTGKTMYIYNRTQQKASTLLDKGASWCGTPKEVAERSDIVFSIVGFPKDVEEIILGEQGVIKSAKQGLVIVDMTTSSPILAEKIYNITKENEMYSLDAPCFRRRSRSQRKQISYNGWGRQGYL